MKKGILIAIEGIDGSGKSTSARALYEFLKLEHDVVLTKEPGGTDLGKHLRTLLHERTFALCPRSEYLLFAADRAQHIEEVVMPALSAGKIVISDRMGDSSRAYQGWGRGLGDTWIKQINEWAMQCVTPDVTIYLKIDYATGFLRFKKRNETMTTFEKEKAEFFERIIEGFETIFKERNTVIKIDADQPESVVHQTVIERVRELL